MTFKTIPSRENSYFAKKEKRRDGKVHLESKKKERKKWPPFVNDNSALNLILPTLGDDCNDDDGDSNVRNDDNNSNSNKSNNMGEEELKELKVKKLKILRVVTDPLKILKSNDFFQRNWPFTEKI